MNCSCLYVDVDEGDMAQCATTSTPTARTSHTCSECGATIQPGEKYERMRGLFSGYWLTEKTCQTCLEIRRGLMCNWMYGMLWEHLRDVFEDGYEVPWAKIGELPKKARDVLCDWIEEEIWEAEE